MTQASGVFTQVRYKKEATYGTQPGASGAQTLRRTSCDIDLTKDVFSSNEIVDDQQKRDSRHGVRRVGGNLNGELSPKTYADFFAAALRRDFSAVSSLTGLSLTITAFGSLWKIARGSGDFLASAAKKGKVIRLTAGSFVAGNMNKNLLVVGVTALELTVKVLNGSALTAEGPIASATIAFPGKETYVPSTGHTNDSFSIERFYADIGRSEVFTGCQPSQIDVQLPPTGLATVAFQMMGKDRVADVSAYFTSPTAATTTGLTAAVNGVALVGGVVVSNLTGLSFAVKSDRTGDAVVGSNTIDTKFPGRVTADGQFTAYFEDGTYQDAFDDETELEIIVVLTTSNAAAADFISFAMPRIKVNGGSKSDGEGGVVQTVPFELLKALTGGSGVANELTTVYVQDSAA